jgi:hypothetical protein
MNIILPIQLIYLIPIAAIGAVVNAEIGLIFG